MDLTSPRVAAVIPALDPPPSLLPLVQALGRSPLVHTIVVVDDGSRPGFEDRFQAAAAVPRVVLLRHAANRGKGAALKTGMAHAAALPGVVGVVTADADGQHAAADVLRVAEAMAARRDVHLGVRAVGRDAPLRSRFGNALTRHVLRLVTGLALRDTQTGLRAIPAARLPELLALPDNGYDYEMDMLVACARRGYPVVEVPIETIYLEGNPTSHFSPVLDSLRIYYVLLRYVVSSLLSALVDNVVFVAAFGVTASILTAQVIGRVGGASVNYWLNRNQVFRSRAPGRRDLVRYLALVIGSGALSYGLIRGFVAAGLAVLPSKLLAESLVFFGNFALQRTLVFPPERKPRP